MTEIVITGMGATTPLGGDLTSTWQAMLNGESGITGITEDWAAELPARIAGFVKVDPAEVIDRPKGYFPVPALKYLRGPFLELVRDVLNAPAARERGLFRRDYLDRLLADPERHITPLRGSKLWQVALLEFWFQEQGL